MGQTPSHAHLTLTMYLFYWTSKNHPRTPMPSIGMSPNISSVLSMSSIHNSPDLHQTEGPMTEVTPLQCTSTCIATIPIGSDPRAFPPHLVCPTFIVNTLWANGRRSPTWVSDHIPLSGSTQHIYGAFESTQPLEAGDTMHAVACSGAIHI